MAHRGYRDFVCVAKERKRGSAVVLVRGGTVLGHNSMGRCETSGVLVTMLVEVAMMVVVLVLMLILERH
jgi:thioester reductase-like protein